MQDHEKVMWPLRVLLRTHARLDLEAKTWGSGSDQVAIAIVGACTFALPRTFAFRVRA